MDDHGSSDPRAWRNLKAPSLAEFELLADSAFRRLPQKFRALCEDLVIRVEDFPEEKVLDDLGAESEFDLLGLFQGVGLPFRSESAPLQMPNMIWLYRRPILDYWAEHEETLGAIVTHVLVHVAQPDRLFALDDREFHADPKPLVLRRARSIEQRPQRATDFPRTLNLYWREMNSALRFQQT
jgi:predicted Zn-dependent protease with MMP-like domain